LPISSSKVSFEASSSRPRYEIMPRWNWIALGALALLVVYQQFRMYLADRESKKREQLFQIVTENAADMIALVDVKDGG
jgi:hypothetical protein